MVGGMVCGIGIGPHDQKMDGIPSGFVKIAMENYHIEIVDLPIRNGNFLVRYVRNYQAGYLFET